MLPTDDFDWYAAVDIGGKGGIAVMDAGGSSVKAWPMPYKKDLDLSALANIFLELRQLSSVMIGIEWSTAWAGSFGNVASDAMHFGQQQGVIESFAYLHAMEYHKISPQLWLGRLGLAGKQHEGEIERRVNLFENFYPESKHLIRGPRGGLLDGPLDALLICHFLRTRGSGMKTVVDKFGKDSPQALIMALGGGRRKHKMRLPKADS
jgi:hypothetical protein